MTSRAAGRTLPNVPAVGDVRPGDRRPEFAIVETSPPDRPGTGQEAAVGKFTWVRQGIVGRIAEVTRMLPFARPDRAPGGPIRVEPPHRSGPPPRRTGSPPELKPQHHVHPSDDEARRQDKG